MVVRDPALGVPSINPKGGDTMKKRMKFDHLSTLCVGLDIGSRSNFITALNFDSDRLINMRPVSNAANGVETMEAMILAVLEGSPQFRYLLVAMESTSFYGVHVANYLSTSDLLKPYGVKVFCLNPKTVANYKKTFTGLGKNDGIDSFIVADYVRAGLIEIEPWRGSQYLALQRLTRQRRHISEAIAREKNYVLNNIFLKFSEFALLSGEDSPVSNKFSTTAEAVLTEFKTTEDIANAPLDELIDFISTSVMAGSQTPIRLPACFRKQHVTLTGWIRHCMNLSLHPLPVPLTVSGLLRKNRKLLIKPSLPRLPA